MRVTTVLFDLDGTLLPMDQDAFTTGYFKLLAKKMSAKGYKGKELVDAVWAGTAAMVKNDGSKSNESAFWEKFAGIYGEKVWEDKPLFEEFYQKEFTGAKAFCGFNPQVPEAIGEIKKRGYRLVLATNPIFPKVATEARIGWAGLAPSDFVLYTTYENTGYCKPNIAYYRDLLSRLRALPEECLMVGNDVGEDMVARELGLQVFLITDCLINRENKDIRQFPNGSFQQLLETLRTPEDAR